MARRRSSSFSIQEELILIKPSTELLADEYDISNQLPTVHIFYNESNEDIKPFKEALEHYKYEIPIENEHDLLNNDLLVTLDEIRGKSANYSGLILFFCGFYEIEGHIIALTENRKKNIPLVDIWSKFTSYNCEHLRDKPKIFIFQLHNASSIQTDSVERFKYDAPAEADMAIIFNTESIHDFVEDFSNNLRQYGTQEEILLLASVSGNSGDENNSTVVSTLTKKFYIAHNETRGHISQVYQYNSEISEVLQTVTDKMDEIILAKDKDKSKSTFKGVVNRARNTLMKMNSMRRPRDELKKTEETQEDNKKKQSKSKTKASSSKVGDKKKKVSETDASQERKTFQNRAARRRNSSTSSATGINRNTKTKK